MDFKKIKPKDVLSFLDELVAKIPESISSILTKVMIGILVIACIYAGYYGYLIGIGSATQEGQELAKDTKSLFLEDIEREYNRRRKNIRMPSTDSLMSDEIYKTRKHYEPYGRANEINDIVPQEISPLENDKSIRAYKRKGDTYPLAELNDTNPIPDSLGGQEYENAHFNLKSKKNKPLMDNFDNPQNQSEGRDLDSVLDKVNANSDYEKKILTKKESNKKNKESFESGKSDRESFLKKDSGRLIIPEKSQKREKKRDILPVDGKD